MTKVIIPESKIDAVKQDLALIEKEAGSVQVSTFEQCEEAAHFLAKVVSRERRIQEIYKAFVEPFELALKDAQNKVKMMSEPYKDIAEKIRTAMGDFLQDFYEAERKTAEKSKEPVEMTSFSVRTENGLVYITEREDYDIIEMDKVPSEYLVTTVDAKKVKMAMKNGVEIPGIKYLKRVSLATRS